MLLFIISEIMVFGAFFTAYFFIRIAQGDPWPATGTTLPVSVAGVNTAILVSSSFTIHWAEQSIKRGNRFGLKAGMLVTFLLGCSFLFIQINEYANIGFAPQDAAQQTIFYSLTGLHGAHVFIGLLLLLFVTIRSFRGTTAQRTTVASRCPASTGTSSTSCGSSSTHRLHPLTAVGAARLGVLGRSRAEARFAPCVLDPLGPRPSVPWSRKSC